MALIEKTAFRQNDCQDFCGPDFSFPNYLTDSIKFFSFSCVSQGEHLGTEIAFEDLPEEVRKYVLVRVGQAKGVAYALN